jgi:peptide chain release factor 1
MLERLSKVEARYEELTRLMADPIVAQDYERVSQYAKERADLEDVVSVYRAYKDAAEELEGTKTLLADDADPELRELAEGEIAARCQERDSRDPRRGRRR